MRNRRRKATRLVVPLLSGLVLILAMVAAPASQAASDSGSVAPSQTDKGSLTGEVPVRVNPDPTAGPQLCVESARTEACVELGLDGSIIGELPDEFKNGPGDVITPQWKLEFGWNFYLYLNQSNVTWLTGLGYATYAAVLCSWLAPTLIGAVACAGAAYIIWGWLGSWATRLPAGHCLRIVINYAGIPTGVSSVRRSC